MASYISVPRDLSNVKTKLFFNLTKRQLICFGLGAAAGIPVFFLIKAAGNLNLASMGMIIVMLPMFLLAMYEKDGQPLEKSAWYFISSRFIRPRIRPYRTCNYYALLMKQYDLEREVERIVQNRKKE